jgi:hypothetical protein
MGKEGNGMRLARGYGLLLGLVVGITLGAPVALSGVDARVARAALSVFIDDAVAEDGDHGRVTVSNGDDGNDGNSGDGGFEAIRDVGNASEDASSNVTVGDITTPDAIAPDVNVNAQLATNPVLAIAGSFRDTGVDVFAPNGNSTAQAGTTGGYGLTADSSGGDSGDAGAGGDATSRGGNGGG